MPLRDWFRSPRHLIGLFALVTVGLSLLLLLFGRRLIQQEFTLGQARDEARRSEAAELLVTRLDQALVATEEVLRDPEAMRLAAVTPDSVTLAIVGTQLEVLPYGRLLYYPVAAAGESAADEVFAEGEALEHARNDPSQAAVFFQRLARGADAPTKAGALVRAARNLRKSGRPDAALAVYSEAARLKTTAIGDVPTELLARAARCSLLADLRSPELRREALELRDLLLDGRWRITRPAFEMYLGSASRWAGAGERPANYLLALSAAVDAVWSSRTTASASTEASDGWVGRRWTISAGDAQFTVLSQRRGSRTHALIAGPVFVQDQWKSRLAPLEARHRVRVTLQDAGQPGAGEYTRRAASDTGLPWTLVVRDATDIEAPLQSRRGSR